MSPMRRAEPVVLSPMKSAERRGRRNRVYVKPELKEEELEEVCDRKETS